jgi:hypothetical protein
MYLYNEILKDSTFKTKFKDMEIGDVHRGCHGKTASPW